MMQGDVAVKPFLQIYAGISLKYSQWYKCIYGA